jgi:hypothetical protein
MRVPNHFPLFVLAGGLPLTALLLTPHQPQQAGPVRKLVLVIHGGEADLPEELMKDLGGKNPVTRERVREYKKVLEESLTKGYALLGDCPRIRVWFPIAPAESPFYYF